MTARTLLTAVAALAALGFTAIAHAAPIAASASEGALSASVPTAGLNLHSEAGATIALNRIRAAASQVCGAQPDRREIAATGTYRACLKVAVDRAVASVDDPVLTALNVAPRSTAILTAGAR